jgi:hypothetical protein
MWLLYQFYQSISPSTAAFVLPWNGWVPTPISQVTSLITSHHCHQPSDSPATDMALVTAPSGLIFICPGRTVQNRLIGGKIRAYLHKNECRQGRRGKAALVINRLLLFGFKQHHQHQKRNLICISRLPFQPQFDTPSFDRPKCRPLISLLYLATDKGSLIAHYIHPQL